METGNVKWFDGREGKNFGFILTDNGREIFFHYNDGRPLRINKTNRCEEFCEEVFVRTERGLKNLRKPVQGDKVVFKTTQGSKGEKASPWCFKSIHDLVIDMIAKMPPSTEYRALETMHYTGEPAQEPKVLWQGTDLELLVATYPRPRGHQSPSADPLLPFYADSDNIFEVERWFEYKDGDNWTKCGDPRPR